MTELPKDLELTELGAGEGPVCNLETGICAASQNIDLTISPAGAIWEVADVLRMLPGVLAVQAGPGDRLALTIDAAQTSPEQLLAALPSTSNVRVSVVSFKG